MIQDLELHHTMNSVLIINLDHHNQVGSHFVALIIDKHSFDKIIYFDPLGLDIYNKHIINSISIIDEHFLQLSKPIQDPLSDFCGLFCLAACVSKYFRTSIRDFLNIFSTNLKKKLYNCI
jgi:hypothetical protein